MTKSQAEKQVHRNGDNAVSQNGAGRAEPSGLAEERVTPIRSFEGSFGTRLWRSLRARGWLATMTRIVANCQQRCREASWGIDTRGHIDGRDLGYSENYFGYQPIPHDWCDWALQQACSEPARETFLDYGCGKGRAVIAAARLPFRRVIGVELSAELAAVARHNIRNAGSRLVCRNVEIFHGDAFAFPFPDDVTVVMLFNPFHPALVLRLAEGWRASLERAPRPFVAVYVLPAGQADCLRSLTWLAPRIEFPRTAADGQALTIFEARLGNHG